MSKRKAQRSRQRKASRGKTKKQKGGGVGKRKKQKGGAAPFFVDFKQGVKVTQDLIRDLKKPVNKEKAEAAVRGYKQEYQAYKRRGGNKSYNSWILDKGYGVRNSGCCIM